MLMSSFSEYLGALIGDRIFIPFDEENETCLTYYMCYRKNSKMIKQIEFFRDWIIDYLKDYNAMWK